MKTEGLIKLVRKHADVLSKLMQAEPYRLNLLDEIKANENAHTRILMKLLQFKEDGKLAVLESFLDMVFRLCNSERRIYLGEPRLNVNAEYIDGLILYHSQAAFIIENKVKGAIDQTSQLANYVQKVTNKNIPFESTYVIYLTYNGDKKVSESSLPSDLRRNLCNRFLPMNYRDHILPWLKEDVLPNLKTKERILISAIEQYVDFLEGQFYKRDYQQKTMRNINDKILKELGIENNKTSDQYNIINDLAKGCDGLLKTLNFMIEEKRKEIFENFTSITKAYWGSEWKLYDYTSSGYYQIKKAEWENYHFPIHLEWIPLRAKTLLSKDNLILEIHDEGCPKRLKASIREATKHVDGACNNGKVIYSTKYDGPIPETGFYSLTVTEQKGILEECYSKSKMFIEIVETIINEQLVVKLHQACEQMSKSENFPFEKIWFWKMNYLVLGEKNIKIDIDCTLGTEVNLSYFNQSRSIKSDMNDKFCEGLGMQYRDGRYRISIYDNCYEKVLELVKEIVEHNSIASITFPDFL